MRVLKARVKTNKHKKKSLGERKKERRVVIAAERRKEKVIEVRN